MLASSPSNAGGAAESDAAAGVAAAAMAAAEEELDDNVTCGEAMFNEVVGRAGARRAMKRTGSPPHFDLLFFRPLFPVLVGFTA